jgi:hypothetical protein
MNIELISRLRTATVADKPWFLYEIMSDAADELEQGEELRQELMGIIAEQAYEIDRLKKIIRNYYAEECAYNDQVSDRIDPDFTVPQTWKDAYRAFEQEAMSIGMEFYEQ